MREYRATVGETDGNIIAVIITIQTPRNQPSAPRSVPGPSSIPRMRSAVDHQATPESTSSRAISATRARAAAKAGARPVAAVGGASELPTAPMVTSGSPGEPRRREGCLALVVDAEGVDARARRLGDGQLGCDWMEDPGHTGRLSRFHAERHDVLDLEVDVVTDLDAVTETLLANLDRGALHAQALRHERTERRHRPAELTTEDPAELVHLVVRRGGVDEHAEAPVPLAHDLRRVGDRGDLEAADVRALYLPLSDVEHERHTATVVVGAERQ